MSYKFLSDIKTVAVIGAVSSVEGNFDALCFDNGLRFSRMMSREEAIEGGLKGFVIVVLPTLNG